jgi:hypothetical protein
LGDPAQTIQYTVVGADDNGIHHESLILGSTSVGDLRALLYAAHSMMIPRYRNDHPTCDDFKTAQVASCLGGYPAPFSHLTIPADSLLLSIYRGGTIGQFGCRMADIQSVTLQGTTLSVNLVNRMQPCLADDDADWISNWLLAIRLKDLPAKVLTLKLNHPPLTRPQTDWPTEFSSVVDLTQPPMAAPAFATRVVEAERAILASEVDIAKRLNKPAWPDWFLNGIGARRWADTGLGCAAPGNPPVTKQVSGYVVIVSFRNEGIESITGTYEYHVGDGHVLYCSGGA